MFSPESRCLKLLAVSIVCPGRASDLESENFSIIVIAHLLSKSRCVFVCVREEVCRKKRKCVQKLVFLVI